MENYICDMCHMKFASEHGMRIHKGKMHSENKRKHLENEKDVMKCQVCNFVGVSTEDVKSHMAKMHNKSSVNCVSCNYVGVSSKEMESHMHLMHVESVNKNSKQILV